MTALSWPVPVPYLRMPNRDGDRGDDNWGTFTNRGCYDGQPVRVLVEGEWYPPMPDDQASAGYLRCDAEDGVTYTPLPAQAYIEHVVAGDGTFAAPAALRPRRDETARTVHYVATDAEAVPTLWRAEGSDLAATAICRRVDVHPDVWDLITAWVA